MSVLLTFKLMQCNREELQDCVSSNNWQHLKSSIVLQGVMTCKTNILLNNELTHYNPFDCTQRVSSFRIFDFQMDEYIQKLFVFTAVAYVFLKKPPVEFRRKRRCGYRHLVNKSRRLKACLRPVSERRYPLSEDVTVQILEGTWFISSVGHEEHYKMQSRPTMSISGSFNVKGKLSRVTAVGQNAEDVPSMWSIGPLADQGEWLVRRKWRLAGLVGSSLKISSSFWPVTSTRPTRTSLDEDEHHNMLTVGGERVKKDRLIQTFVYSRPPFTE